VTFIGEKMLFSEYKYFQHSFPEPQYLGAKHTLISWLNKHIPRDVKTALDAFGGSQSAAFFLKQRGFTTTTNDFLNFNHQIGLALIENKDQMLTDEDIHLLLNIDATPDPVFQLIEDTYTGVQINTCKCRAFKHQVIDSAVNRFRPVAWCHNVRCRFCFVFNKFEQHRGESLFPVAGDCDNFARLAVLI